LVLLLLHELAFGEPFFAVAFALFVLSATDPSYKIVYSMVACSDGFFASIILLAPSSSYYKVEPPKGEEVSTDFLLPPYILTDAERAEVLP
jgi:hypothetical protein